MNADGENTINKILAELSDGTAENAKPQTK